MSLLRISAKFEKVLDSLEDPDALDDLEMEWQKITAQIVEFERKLDNIIVERKKNG